MSLLAGARPGPPPLVSAVKSLMRLSLLVMHHLPQKPLAIFHPLTSLKHVVFPSSSPTFFLTLQGQEKEMGENICHLACHLAKAARSFMVCMFLC